jgi:hypothetical protein
MFRMGTEEKEIASDEIQSLRELVAKLHARVDFLEKKHERAAKIACDCDELLTTYCDRLSADTTDAFGRIKNLELTVFPHLAADLDELHKVIGETDNQPECPQERRKP